MAPARITPTNMSATITVSDRRAPQNDFLMGQSSGAVTGGRYGGDGLQAKERNGQARIHREDAFAHKAKDYENYVVNAVWSRLGDGSPKPVSQQWLARPDGKGCFTDPCFPQANMGVECGEAYHKGQQAHDRVQGLDLIDILNAMDAEHGYRALRVDVS